MHSKRPYGFRFHDFFLPLPHENFHYISTGNSHRSNGLRCRFPSARLNGDDFRIAQVKTELTLVFLYNSDCDACRKGAAQIEKSATVNSLTTAKS